MRRRSLRLLAILASSAISISSGTPVVGQTSGVESGADTALQMLQGLTPEQRDAIKQQFGLGGGQSTSGLGRQNDQTQQQSDQDRDRTQPMGRMRTDEEVDQLSPYLKGEDWIVVTIDSEPLAPTPTSLIGNLQQQQQQQQPGAPLSLSGLPTNLPLPLNVQATVPLSAQQNVPPNVTAGGTVPKTANAPGTAGVNGTQDNAPPELTDEEKKTRDKLIELIRSKNPYQLSREGVLSLPGFAPIPMAGLSEQLATLRLGVEPALSNLYIRVTKLPLKKLGPTALKPFGYELFDRFVSTFAPANVPVPANYVIGPGDELIVQLFGSQNRIIQLTVGRDGRVQFPELGPVHVGGETYNSAKATLEARVERQMIGVHASISMGETRSIRVFVLGDAKRPGSYTISGLGTITSALFAAGGIQSIGSLRNIELKRDGTLVRRLDLYDMLIRGDTTDDAKLLPGDVIFIPPVGPTVSVDGEVRRPAIYETRNETSVAQVVQLAGGLTPEADVTNAALTRIDPAQHRVVLQVNLAASGAKAQPVHNGDLLRISRLRPTLDAGVVVEGYVYSTGAFAYHDGMRLTEVVRSVDDLRPNADIHYLLIRRELPPDRHIVVVSADLDAALKAPGSAADIPLMARDRITVFDLQSSRDRVIQPLLDDLKLQANINRPTEVVRIEGRAKVPGNYPLETGMTVRDLVRAGGSLSDAAYGGSAELTRYKVLNGDSRRTELIPIDLAAVMRGDPSANIRLEPFDSLSIKEVQSWTELEDVTLLGEVRFPGKYSIKRGETLKSVVTRAGGLSDFAFAQGAVFTRKELREREQKQLDQLAGRMQTDIAFVALQGAAANQSQAGTSLAVGQSLLTQLRATKAVGRLVINLPRALRAPTGSALDVILRGGDQLIVPKFQQEVTVIGEVQSATSHLYRPELARDDYISMSGGKTRRADSGRIYVVRADGSVVSNEGNRWYHSRSVRIQPGDTIVVPLDAEHLPLLPLWQAVTQIIYNVAIAAAAVHSF